ncbi:MAG: hypothetical protein AAF222_06845 [Pseudomonadota bacterium]
MEGVKLMKKTAFLTVFSLLSACADLTAPVSELDGKPVYRASFSTDIDDPNPSLDEVYRLNKRNDVWFFHDCVNGMKEVGRSKVQAYIYPTPSIRQLAWSHTVLFQCV